MSFQNGINLTFEADMVNNETCVTANNDVFDILDTNCDGLRELLRNVDTAHIACSKECAKMLYKCGFNSGRVFLCRTFPESMKVDENTVSGYIFIENPDRICIILRKSLKLPYDDLITNFKLRDVS